MDIDIIFKIAAVGIIVTIVCQCPEKNVKYFTNSRNVV